jgi:Ser/Thr protein kinase RdoA (MazF antagonist)
LQKYELEWDSIHFIQVSEHVTFRIDCGEGDKYLLRIHSGNKSAEATLSELEWLNHLGRKEIIVPNGVMNREGSLITTLPDEDGQTYYATMLRWVEGERLDKWSLTDEQIQQMGMLMADLHTGTSDFAASRVFTRPHWAATALNGIGSICSGIIIPLLQMKLFNCIRMLRQKSWIRLIPL